MDALPPIQDMLATQTVDIPLLGVFINLILAAILATLTAETYVRYGEVLGNRRAFARNFVPIALTTVMIITVVKSSLALSLGLVGALSIVRFRTAIKDPEELSYLFLTIAIGLGLGADQRPLTLMATFVILTMLWLKHRQMRSDKGANLYLSSDESAVAGILSEVDAAFDSVKIGSYPRHEASEDHQVWITVEAATTDKVCQAVDRLLELLPKDEVVRVDRG